MTGLAELDTRLFLLLNREWTSSLLDVVMPYLTDFDHWRVPLILVLLAVLARGSTETRFGILFAVLAVVAADQISSGILKSLIERPRPFDAVEGARKLIGAHASSFPSSHAANTFAAGTFLALRFRRWRPALILPPLVAYSRVYVGVHYPSDVLAGSALGIGVGSLFAAIERVSRMRIGHWFRRRKVREPPEGETEAGTDGGAGGGAAGAENRRPGAG